MKRFSSSGQGSFARYGIKGHTIRTSGTYRGGVRL